MHKPGSNIKMKLQIQSHEEVGLVVLAIGKLMIPDIWLSLAWLKPTNVILQVTTNLILY